MGLTERHWFEDEDVPENYEWALEDAVYNSRASKKLKDSALMGRSDMMADKDSVINDLNIVKLILCNPQMLTPGMCIKIGQAITSAIALLKAQEPITGETSDGYHTFNELYHHRAVLFSVIVANYPDRAWKSKKHHDGTMYNGMFIVGIDTPDGQATYHYDIDPYWDMFKCRMLDSAPEWDGHTPTQAIERIGKLKAREAVKPYIAVDTWICPKCGHALESQYLIDDKENPQVLVHEQYNFCPNCGKAVKWNDTSKTD